MTLQEFLLQLGIDETELSTIKSVMRPNHMNILGYTIEWNNNAECAEYCGCNLRTSDVNVVVFEEDKKIFIGDGGKV